MKAIIVDDNVAFAEMIRQKLESDSQLLVSTKDPREVAQEIVQKVTSEEQKGADEKLFHIFINIEGKFGGTNRQAQEGVKVLLWLRCKHRMCNPIILYSFQSNQQLLKSRPESFIINSHGCYYCQLPFDFSRIKSRSLPRVDNLDALKRYLKLVFSLEQFRHREANWWGVKCLWDVHRMVTLQNKQDFPYPVNLNERLNELNNTIAQFIFTDEDIKLGKVLHGMTRLPINETIFVYMAKTWIKQTIDDNNANTFRRLDYVKSLRYQIDERKPKILHVDDQASDGWADIFRHMLYANTQSQEFKVLSFDVSFNISNSIDQRVNDIYRGVKALIQPNGGDQIPFDPDIILLDVRLIPDYDEGLKHDVENMSGALLLKKIRKEYPAIPVIVTTASNKVWTYEEMIKLGADAYWIKEGLDEQRNAEESVRNYIGFLELVGKATREEYRFLKTAVSKMNSLLDAHTRQSFWWERKDWNRDSIRIDKTEQRLKRVTTVLKRELRKIYLDGMELYRQFLSHKVLRKSFELNEMNEWFYYSSIMIHLGKTIELIHNLYTKDYEAYGSFSKVIGHRNDKRGLKLYGERNAAAHLGKSKGVDFDRLRSFIENLNQYLEI